MNRQKPFSILLIIVALCVAMSCGSDTQEDSVNNEIGNFSAGLREKSPKSQGVLEDSVFMIKSKKIDMTGMGFIVKGNILITSFRVIDSLVDQDKNADLNSIYITNINNEIFHIKKLLALDIIADLALLEVKDYTGGELLLSNSSYQDSQHIHLAGFSNQELEIIDTTNKINIDAISFSTLYFNKDIKGEGGPLVNEHKEVVGVAREANNRILWATKKDLLQEYINEIPYLKPASGNIFERINKEKGLLLAIGYQKRDKEILFIIGSMYLRGQKGFERNFGEAMYWLVTAAQK
ncbi:MAG: hypothetical protein OXB84_08960, partial [Halobacteriovoraceae bacterium]|nr:hypothetical protein [Halobacteriovoraceae bacterium]